ncbi:hypothetical protein [Arcobacter sp.]|uniref:hypothetical protein n=1 Tax=Arcobacter sp. TaxID=1872629 RepID=UPI003C773F42
MILEYKTTWEHIRRDNYLDEKDIIKLTESELLEIYINTLKKVEKYYRDNDIELRVYYPNERITSKKFDETNIDNNQSKAWIKSVMTKNDMFLDTFFIHVIDDKERYLNLMYEKLKYYGDFYYAYTTNNKDVKTLIKLLNDTPKLEEHFSKQLNDIIIFHQNIKQNQLAQYFCFYGLGGGEDEEYHKVTYILFNYVFRTEIRNITIDRDIANPYIEFL